jgi:RNA polymerase sigma factor (sigma-70 family)
MNEKLVLDYMPLANSIAWKQSKITPRWVSFEELKSAAYLGLVDAANKFDMSKGSFGNYAKIRIFGAIKDHLKLLLDYGINKQEEFFVENFEKTTTEDFFEFISRKLTTFEARVIRMYYIESRTMKEIGRKEKISESRVSQVISRVQGRLKKILKEV